MTPIEEAIPVDEAVAKAVAALKAWMLLGLRDRGRSIDGHLKIVLTALTTVSAEKDANGRAAKFRQDVIDRLEAERDAFKKLDTENAHLYKIKHWAEWHPDQSRRPFADQFAQEVNEGLEKNYRHLQGVIERERNEHRAALAAAGERITQLEHYQKRMDEVSKNRPDYELLWAELAERIEEVEDELASARRVMEPFAAFATKLDQTGHYRRSIPDTQWVGPDLFLGLELTVGHLRAAATLLAGQPEQKEG